MNPFVNIALFGWLPLSILLFGILPRRQAALISIIGGWMFLPCASFHVPGIPPYTKACASVLGVVLSMVVFDSRSVFAFRPTWADISICVLTFTPFFSSLSNGLGAYDGFDECYGHMIMWLLPYFIGRVYFSNTEAMRQLAVAIFVGGLIYVPLCLFEIQFSPQLHNWVYGFHQSEFGMTKRFGGYRPLVFMQTGLAVGLWMTAACICGFWLRVSRSLFRIQSIPVTAFLWAIVITTIWCKSAGAIVLLAIGLSILFWNKYRRSIIPFCLLLLIAPAYVTFRGSGYWSGENIVSLISSTLGEDRAQSLEYRFRNENLLSARAMERPLLGWAGWGRSHVFSERGRDMTVADGQWIILLGENGIVGLLSLMLVLLTPAVIAMKKIPANLWSSAYYGPTACMAVLLGLFMLDDLLNAMPNPIFMVIAGGLTGTLLGMRSVTTPRVKTRQIKSVISRSIPYQPKFTEDKI